MSTPRHALSSALEAAADGAEAAARDQQRAAAIARDAARDLDPGNPADHPQATRATSRVLRLLAGSAQRLTATAGSLRRAWAQSLADENLSLRQIGERLGVTHQRVSALLARHRRDVPDTGVQ